MFYIKDIVKYKDRKLLKDIFVKQFKEKWRSC